MRHLRPASQALLHSGYAAPAAVVFKVTVIPINYKKSGHEIGGYLGCEFAGRAFRDLVDVEYANCTFMFKYKFDVIRGGLQAVPARK